MVVYYRTDARPPLTPEEVQEFDHFGPPLFVRVATIADDASKNGQREVLDHARAGTVDVVVTRRGIDLSPDGFRGWIRTAAAFHEAGLTIWVWKEKFLNLHRESKKLYPALVALQGMEETYQRDKMRGVLREAEAKGRHIGRRPNCETPNCNHPPTKKGKPIHANGTGKCSLCGCQGYQYRGMEQKARVSTTRHPEPEEDDDEDEEPEPGSSDSPQRDDDQMGSSTGDGTDSGPA